MSWEQAEVSRIGDFESQVLDLGEMVCARHLIPAGFDSVSLYRGLPDDMCPCEHWCYLARGRLLYRFADGGELAVRGGEAFHLRAGHLAEALENAELIEFTAAADYRRKAEHLSGRSDRNPTTADEPILLCPYDPAWSARFEREREALAEAIGEWTVDGVHHVGSTAVPGLEAKPIVDILVGVRDLDESRACFEPLARLGYLYAPYLTGEMHWFCKPHPSRRTHHLHLVPAGSERYLDELAFRDRLRADPKLAEEYQALKRSLASRFANDREAYTDAKSEFVRDALR